MTADDQRRLGRYRLEHVIGTGAFATVYRAVDQRLEDVVAIKVLAENHSLDADVRDRFLAEGRVLRRIDSPHVVGVHDLGESDRAQPYLVLEHADRGTLRDRVTTLRSEGWRPTVADVLAVARPLAAAVEAVHRANVVHRDLSPGNVLLRQVPPGPRTAAEPSQPGATVVREDERLLLADLGLCKDLARHSGLTAAGGTEGFRAPEQRRGPAVVAPEADLWALSALLVWLVSGSVPAEGSSRAAIVAAGLPDPLGDVLDRGLAEDPAARQADVTAWLDDVEEALRPPAPVSLPAPPVPPSEGPATAASPPPRRSGRRAGGWLVGAGLGLVGLLVGAGVVAAILLVGGGPEVSDLGDGQVRVERTVDGATVAIVGPEEVDVGDTATFRADGAEVATWVWIDPAGQLHPDARAVEVRTTSPGVAVLRLVGVGPAGTPVEVEHRLVVHEP